MDVVLGILKKHGLDSPEFQTRAKILQAVADKKFDDPVLKENFTPEQLAEMQKTPPATGGGLEELRRRVESKAKAVARSQTARDAVATGKDIAQSAFSKAKTATSKLMAIDPVRDIPKELDPNREDGFITMMVKWMMRMASNAMASPSWPMIVKTVFGFVFVLSYAQGIPIFGGMIRATLEIVAFILPTIGDFIVSLATAIGGPFGNPIGILIAAVFFILAAMIAFSRKDFTEAVAVSANLIPFIGGFVSSMIRKADRTAAKLAAAQRQVVNSFLDILRMVFGQGKKTVRGGMRFSRRRSHTKKWRTQKRRMSGRL